MLNVNEIATIYMGRFGLSAIDAFDLAQCDFDLAPLLGFTFGSEDSVHQYLDTIDLAMDGYPALLPNGLVLQLHTKMSMTLERPKLADC